MKINKNEFLSILQKVRPGISNKEIIEFSDSICFLPGKIITFNDEICVEHPFDSQFQGTVKADHFYRIVDKMATNAENEIELEQTENEMVIKGGKAQSGVLYNAKGSLPLEEVFEGSIKFKPISDGLLEGIKLGQFCTSPDDSLPILQCVHIRKDTIQSSDSYRCFKYAMVPGGKEEFLLPKTCISVLMKYPVTKYCIQSNWAHFKTKEGIILHVRIFQNQEFPDISSFFDLKGIALTFPEKVLPAVERAAIFCSTQELIEELLSVSIEEKKIVLSAQKKDVGWFKETIPQMQKNKIKNASNITFKINAEFFLDLLKTTTKCFFVEKNDQTLLGFKTEKWQHVISVVKK